MGHVIATDLISLGMTLPDAAGMGGSEEDRDSRPGPRLVGAERAKEDQLLDQSSPTELSTVMEET